MNTQRQSDPSNIHTDRTTGRSVNNSTLQQSRTGCPPSESLRQMYDSTPGVNPLQSIDRIMHFIRSEKSDDYESEESMNFFTAQNEQKNPAFLMATEPSGSTYKKTTNNGCMFYVEQDESSYEVLLTQRSARNAHSCDQEGTGDKRRGMKSISELSNFKNSLKKDRNRGTQDSEPRGLHYPGLREPIYLDAMTLPRTEGGYESMVQQQYLDAMSLPKHEQISPRTFMQARFDPERTYGPDFLRNDDDDEINMQDYHIPRVEPSLLAEDLDFIGLCKMMIVNPDRNGLKGVPKEDLELGQELTERLLASFSSVNSHDIKEDTAEIVKFNLKLRESEDLKRNPSESTHVNSLLKDSSTRSGACLPDNLTSMVDNVAKVLRKQTEDPTFKPKDQAGMVKNLIKMLQQFLEQSTTSTTASPFLSQSNSAAGSFPILQPASIRVHPAEHMHSAEVRRPNSVHDEGLLAPEDDRCSNPVYSGLSPDVFSQSNYNSTHFVKPVATHSSVSAGGSAARQMNPMEHTGEFQMSFGVLRQSKHLPFSFQKDSAQRANEPELPGNILAEVEPVKPFNDHNSNQGSHRSNLLGAACLGLDSNFDTNQMMKHVMYSSCGTAEPQTHSKAAPEAASARSVSFNLSLSHRDTQRDVDPLQDSHCPYGSGDHEVIEIEVANNTLIEVETSRRHQESRRKSCTEYFKQKSDGSKSEKSPRSDNLAYEDGCLMTDRANSSVNNQSSFAFILSQDKDEGDQSSFCHELANFSKKLAAAEANQLRQNAKLEVQLDILKQPMPEPLPVKKGVRMPLVTHLPSIHEVSNEDISFMRESVSSASDRQHSHLKNSHKSGNSSSRAGLDPISRYAKCSPSQVLEMNKSTTALSTSRASTQGGRGLKPPESPYQKQPQLFSVASRSTQQEEWNKENYGDLNLLMSAGTDKKSLDILRSITDPHVVSTESKLVDIAQFPHFQITEDSVQYDEEHKFSMGSFVNLSMDG